MVHGARGLRQILHQCHGPQTHQPSHQFLLGPSHLQRGGYPTSNEVSLQRL